LILEGLIDADGIGADRPDLFSTDGAGAGAGGTVRISAEVVRGGGEIRANGGAALRAAATPGGGGGGRIALSALDLSGFTGSIQARGGGLLPALDRPESQGGAGTVHILRLPGALALLRIDNGGRNSAAGPTPLDLPLEELHLERLEVRGAARASAAIPIRIDLGDLDDAARFTLAGSLAAPRIDLPPVQTVEVSLGDLDAADLRLPDPPPLLHLSDAGLVAHGPLHLSALRLVRSSITVPEPSSTAVFPLVLDVDGTLEIDAASTLDLSGKGHVGGYRGGNTSNLGQTAGFVTSPGTSPRTGGAHGGSGGHYGSGQSGILVQPTYDSFEDPQHSGSGGSSLLGGEPGFNGGGLLRIFAAQVVLDGRIDVRGEGKEAGDGATDCGAGGGGGVFLAAEVLRGTGEIDADGGSAHFDGVHGLGAGGGGRIAIHAADRSAFTGSLHAFGGILIPLPPPTETGPIGGAGTVFLKSGSQVHGDLILDNGGRVQATYRTVLRAVGAGTIQALTATTLRGSKAFPGLDTGLSGQWVVVNGTWSKPFRVAGNTTTVITTRPGDGDMTASGAVGSPYQGAIVLDNLTVRGAALFSTNRKNFGYDLIIIATGAASITDRGMVDDAAHVIVHW
jgi:hypothetical protein